MSDYTDWLEAKRGGRGLNQSRIRDNVTEYGEPSPFNRRRILERELHWAEQDLAYTTRWLADPLGKHNREHFLDLRFNANDRYSRALRLVAKLKPEPVVPTQLKLLP